jgi:predicted CXXCH cytochrome family protein
MRTQVTSEACLSCHQNTHDEHRYMHGPVAVKACLWCHAPHESAHPHLLRTAGNTLCRQCHETSPNRTTHPAHADPDRPCLECHSGHGGPDRYFLRETLRTTPLPGSPVAVMTPDGHDGQPAIEGGP